MADELISGFKKYVDNIPMQRRKLPLKKWIPLYRQTSIVFNTSANQIYKHAEVIMQIT